MEDLHEATLAFLLILMKEKHLQVARAAHTTKQRRLIMELDNIERRLQLEFGYGPNTAASEE